MSVSHSNNGKLLNIKNTVHRAAFYLTDTDCYQCGHLNVGDVCHVYSKYTNDGFDKVGHICNECNSIDINETIFVSLR